jgi:phosphoglycolate phosphatase
MASIPPRLALFDCDGTLVDSQADICTAMEAAFAQHGLLPPDRHAIRRIVGLSVPEAMRALAPDAATQWDALTDGYKAAYAGNRNAGLLAEPLYDGVVDMLNALSAAGWTLGVATGKSMRGLTRCLETHGILERFTTLHTADTHPSKPHPAMVEAALWDTGALPETCFMIGDTSYDIMMARAAGTHALGVDWGYHDAAELRHAGASHVFADPAELTAYLLSV